MFALFFLFIAGLFFLVLFLISRVVPAGKYRTTFVLVILGTLIVYPSLYKISPSYAKFKELCDSPNRSQVIKTKTAAYIYLDWGFSSDCQKGPSFIEKHGYRGFDCKRGDENGIALYRYAKNSEWHEGCGLECFEVSPIKWPETDYRSGYRYGYVDGNNSIITYDGKIKTDPPSSAKLTFADRLLLDEGEMAFARDYTYSPYGRTWAKILGLASGSAPAEMCKVSFSPLDPRDVYKAKTQDQLSQS